MTLMRQAAGDVWILACGDGVRGTWPGSLLTAPTVGG